jgi:hypothetical protein
MLGLKAGTARLTRCVWPPPPLTLYSPDPADTALFAPAARTLDLDVAVFADKLPDFHTGWRL